MRGVLLMLGVAGMLCPMVARAGQDSDRIAQLINQLGSEEYTERQAAAKELDRIGAPALKALQVALDSPDQEIRRRATLLLQSIRKRTENERLLAPKIVHFQFTDTTIRGAIETIRKDTGCNIRCTGNLERRINLDTGRRPFWEAIQQFCEQAKLREVTSPVAQLPNNPVVMPVGVAPPGVIPGIPVAPVNRHDIEPIAPSSTLTLTEGIPEDLPTHIAGSVRVQALRTQRAKESLTTTLRFSAEPQFGILQAIGVRVEEAKDDSGRELELVQPNVVSPSTSTQVVMANGRQIIVNRRISRLQPEAGNGQAHIDIPVELRGVNPESSAISHLKGVASLRIRTAPQTLAKLENVMQGGQVDAPSGVRLSVSDVRTGDSGWIQLTAEVRHPFEVTRYNDNGPVNNTGFAVQAQAAQVIIMNGQVVIVNNAANPGTAGRFGKVYQGLSLLDENSRAIPLINILRSEERMDGNDSVMMMRLTMVFKPEKDHGKPTQLTFRGSKPTQLDVPLEFCNLPVK